MPASIMLRTGEITILSDGRDRLGHFFSEIPNAMLVRATFDCYDATS